MNNCSSEKNMLVWQDNQEKVFIEPWGKNGLRVRSNLNGSPLDLTQALLEPAHVPLGQIAIKCTGSESSIQNGTITATVNAKGAIRFCHAKTGAVLLEEMCPPFYVSNGRRFLARDGDLHKIESWFLPQDGERFYGLGQHKHGLLNQKGCIIDLHQRNTEISIPFLVSSRGYGFVWNNPGIGRVELGHSGTRWIAEGSQQLDYYIVEGTGYAEVLNRYADATGHAPDLPLWASGFWQCKLRYKTQAEVLSVAREYKKRGLPLSIMVIDFFHWTKMGDWKFDPACFPDPRSMTRELTKMGVRLMVSFWPTTVQQSENFAEFRQRGLLVNNERGVDAHSQFIDNGIPVAYYSYYDATNPAARAATWEIIKRNYYDKGVKLFWLDNCEPDINPWDPANLRFFLGNGTEVANIYPQLNQKAFYDGLKAAGEKEVVTLSRSAWLGSQRYSTVVWSGDIGSTFEALQKQVRAGLNMAMSGIPWWTTDIGGFHDGDITTDYFKELIVRWFQYGVFCPIFRLHGYRTPVKAPMPESGAANEVWSFGPVAYNIISKLLFLRERLRPYIHEHLHIASVKGLPIMRPLFVDFPDDVGCVAIDDQYMFGSDIMVAPVLGAGVRERAVYLPTGVEWVDVKTGQTHCGGTTTQYAAPLDTVPVFVKRGSAVTKVFMQPAVGRKKARALPQR